MAVLPCGWSDTLNIHKYIAKITVRVVVFRRTGHQHKSRKNKIRPHKDKPPSRPLNRVAKFTLENLKGEFGFFHYLLYVELLVFKIGSVGCRSPPDQSFLKVSNSIDWRIKQVKYAPRKVFILENNSYAEITYEELCNRAKKGEPKLFLPLHGMLMEVTKDDYDDFYKAENRQKYLNRQSAANGDISYDMLTTDEFNGEDILIDDAEDVSTQVERLIMAEKLKWAIHTLPDDEQELIRLHFFEDMSQTEIAKLYGMNQSNISRKISKILFKIKNLIDN